ncbi:hypothetical protein G6L37_04675 [Agrobacterium rubi]|nr:hypothetical protein [Agrobacterium rubi]NTF24648.1 hypothetical protein [Agrobacterium rubi]
MTSESHARQPSKRFSKLDAIPRHKRATGFKPAIARMYVARRAVVGTTIAASVFLLLSIGTAAVWTRNDVDPLVIAVAEVAKPTEAVPAAVVKEAELAALAPIEPVPDAAEKIDLPAEVTDPVPAASPSAFAKPELSDIVSQDAEETHVEEQANPVRRIIPIAEGLDLYQVPNSDAKAEATKPNPVLTKDFSLPVAGIPSEEEMAGFLSTSAPTSGVIHLIPPGEDLTPTIALPEIVPLPEMRPAQSLAKGTRIEFHIVQGQGVKSGFWLGNKEDPATRRFFVVVAPQLENGDATNWQFINIADGTPADTDRMAVEVTEEAFVSLAKESKEFGKVRNPVIGRGEVGDKSVKWRIASVNGNLIAGWDRETRQ